MRALACAIYSTLILGCASPKLKKLESLCLLDVKKGLCYTNNDHTDAIPIMDFARSPLRQYVISGDELIKVYSALKECRAMSDK